MSTGIAILLAAAFWVMGLGLLVPVLRTVRLLRREDAPGRHLAGKVAVIIPCRGVDPEFSTLLAGLAAQDVPDCRLYFVVASADDEAVPLIRSFLAGRPGLGELIMFPPPPNFGGKIANMMGGVQAALADQATYLAFLDSDTVPGAGFLRHLLEPLANGQAMLSTGGRVLVPSQRSLPQWATSLWMQCSLPGVAEPQWGGAWGGAMALAAADVQRLDLGTVWANAFSDDATLSIAVRKAGGRIAFVPSCLVPNPVHGGWREVLSFMTRQALVLRIHDRRLWYVAWVMAYPMLLALVTGVNLVVGQGLWALATATALLPAVLGLYLLNEATWFRAALPNVRLLSLPPLYQVGVIAALPVMHLLALVRSMAVRRFLWRGQMYEIARGSFRRLESEGSTES